MGLINRCPHVRISGIYGDEINHCGGYRLSCDDCGRLLDGAVSLAKPAPRIISTPEELEALEPDTCTIDKFGDFDFAKAWIDENGKMFVGHVDFLPAVVFATGEQVRAAREAMEEEHG